VQQGSVIIIIIYLLRPKAAQHSIKFKETVEKHKKPKLKYTKIRNNKANHAANETVIHGTW